MAEAMEISKKLPPSHRMQFLANDEIPYRVVGLIIQRYFKERRRKAP